MKFYRYKIVEYASHDIDGEYVSSNYPSPVLTLVEYDLISETPKGYWIGFKSLNYKERWIPKVSKKRYAYPSKKDALTNYIQRTKRRIKILEYQIASCKIGLGLAESKHGKV